MRLTDLPQDVLLSIYAYIAPQDLLALNQTCRTLHALGSSDYVWHQLKIDLPLEIDQKTHAGEYRPFYEIRHSLINAFRIDGNWCSKSTQIQRLTRIDHGGIISRVQLLSEDWLITLSRNQVTDTTYLSAWYLDKSGGAHCAAKVEVRSRPNRFAATVRDHGDSAVVALFNNHLGSGSVEIFSLSLTDDYIFDDAPASPLKRIIEIHYADRLAPGYDLEDHRGMFAEVQANRNIVAVSVARIQRIPAEPLIYQLILINVDTLAAVVLGKTTIEDVTSSKFTFKLFPDHVAILFSSASEGSLYWQDTHAALRLSPSSRPAPGAVRPTTYFIDSLPVLEIGTPQLIRISEYFATCFDVYFTAETLRTAQDTLVITTRRGEKLWVYRLTLPSPTATGLARLRPRVSLELVSSFALKSGTNVENLALGRTGYRMVLLERLWETDEYKLKKITLPMIGTTNRVVVHELIPPHIALPFELYRCISIWFEEAMGRICFGLHTGEVYLLEV